MDDIRLIIAKISLLRARDRWSVTARRIRGRGFGVFGDDRIEVPERGQPLERGPIEQLQLFGCPRQAPVSDREIAARTIDLDSRAMIGAIMARDRFARRL